MARSLNVLGDPWVMLILREAFIGSTRFEQFRSTLKVADNILSARLRTMVEAGLLETAPYRAVRRTHLEYRLTAAGSELLPVVHALYLWGENHRPPADKSARLRIIHTTCGQVSIRSETCSACGQPLEADNVQWLRPWVQPEPVGLIGANGAGGDQPTGRASRRRQAARNPGQDPKRGKH